MTWSGIMTTAALLLAWPTAGRSGSRAQATEAVALEGSAAEVGSVSTDSVKT